MGIKVLLVVRLRVSAKQTELIRGIKRINIYVQEKDKPTVGIGFFLI
jgi:hypothetical protein